MLSQAGAARPGRARGPAFILDRLPTANALDSLAVLAMAEARIEAQRAEMLDERDRIAADLHDHVIGELFAAGLALQSVAAGLGPGTATDRILATIGHLDNTIARIRTAIFQVRLGPTVRVALRDRLMEVADGMVPALGFTPSAQLRDSLDDVVGDRIVDDLVAVLREALSNIARHAHAHRADIRLAFDDAEQGPRLTLDVRDDGVGMAPAMTRRSGLANLAHRATRYGGTFTVTPGEPTGTWLSWSVPTGGAGTEPRSGC